MEPKNERAHDIPIPPSSEAVPLGEYSPGIPQPQLETLGGLPEQQPVRNNEQVRDDTQLASSMAAPMPAPPPVVPMGQPMAASGGAPDVASDDDLIEKEWVDKAKQIIMDTRDDPYRREKEIGLLQIEYIRRRYGREIGGAEV